MENKKKIFITIITIITIMLIAIIIIFVIKNNKAEGEYTGYQLELISEYGGVRCKWKKLNNSNKKENI